MFPVPFITNGASMKQNLLFGAAIILLLLVMLYASSVSETTIETAIEMNKTINQTYAEQTEVEQTEFLLNTTSEAGGSEGLWGSAAIKVPAVDEEGKGIVTWLTVDVVPGKGRTLTDINQLLFWVDTQYSIQTAKTVAENYTNKDLSKVDIIYAIETDADVVEGPSAGAALTVATVAALLNKTVDQNVMITGSIRPDGSIGAVGGIIEKAKAAKDVGATLFLVPEGQSGQVYYKQERKCEQIGPVTYCTTNYIPVETDVEKEVGIDIEEVSTINDALKYFLE